MANIRQLENIEKIYEMSDNPVYSESVRKLRREDPADAEIIFNPLFQSILDNIHSVKLSNDKKAESGDMAQKLLELSAEAKGLVESHNQNENAHGAIKQNVTNITQGLTTLEQKVERYYNGGNADMVDGKHAPELQDYNNLTNKPASFPANGGNADTVDGMHAQDFETPEGAQQKDNAVKEWSKQTFSNPNLLINGGFQVWQRGERFENLYGYGPDRWSFNRLQNYILQKSENGLRFTWNPGGTIAIIYKMEEQEKRQLVGKNICISYSMNGRVSNSVFKIPSMEEYAYMAGNFMDFVNGVPYKAIHNGLNNVVIYLNLTGVAGDTVEINWMKLELGEVATPYVPRSYAEELLLCQRYYEVIPDYRGIYCEVGEEVRSKINFYKKRIIPEVTFQGYDPKFGNGYLHYQETGKTGFDYATHISKQNITLSSLETTLTNRSDITNPVGSFIGKEIRLDAEIY